MQTDSKIRARLKTLSGLNSIFSAMQVITVSKLSKIKERRESARTYREGVSSALSLLLPPKETGEKTRSGKIACVLVSGNRGLCGTFNQEIFFRSASFLSEHQGKRVDFFVFGRRGFEFLKSRKQKIRETILSDNPDFTAVAPLAKKLWEGFLEQEFEEIYLVHNHFYSLLERKAVANRVLPFERAEGGALAIVEADYQAVLYARFEAELYSALCDSFLGEFSARLMTLKSALDNSKKIIDQLIVERNKSRQLIITQQILEIVEASEAIKEEI